MKHFKPKKIISTALAMLFCLPYSVALVYADTDGSELQIDQPATLEVQLGSQWAGVEFQLKTDSGIFPGTVIVDEDGVLRTELGGSESYILSCLNTAVSIPPPEDAPAKPSETKTLNGALDNQAEDYSTDSQVDNDAEVNGIPVQHIILFGGGLLLAVGALVTIQVLKKRRGETQCCDDDENEDDHSD